MEATKTGNGSSGSKVVNAGNEAKNNKRKDTMSKKKSSKTGIETAGINMAAEGAVTTEGCGCPECAQERNSIGAEHGLDCIVTWLRQLHVSGQLMVFNPATRECLTDCDIEGICVNGACVQISLAEPDVKSPPEHQDAVSDLSGDMKSLWQVQSDKDGRFLVDALADGSIVLVDHAASDEETGDGITFVNVEDVPQFLSLMKQTIERQEKESKQNNKAA